MTVMIQDATLELIDPATGNVIAYIAKRYGAWDEGLQKFLAAFPVRGGRSELKERLEFFIPMAAVPTTTHQQKQVRVVRGRPVFYEPAELKAARATLQGHLGKHAPAEPYTKAVRLVTKWCFPISGQHKDGEYRSTRPDTDNLTKLLKDVMTALGYWTDDALVASEIVEKFWADIPGIYVCIAPLETNEKML